uniref:Uncharacterized protein n=1 Tax=Nothobranchius kuhntae TaxID=321403 RepID=A0A1A8I6J7_NOTKU
MSHSDIDIGNGSNFYPKTCIGLHRTASKMSNISSPFHVNSIPGVLSSSAQIQHAKPAPRDQNVLARNQRHVGCVAVFLVEARKRPCCSVRHSSWRSFPWWDRPRKM